MKLPKGRAASLLRLCYGMAAALWVLGCVIRCGVMLYHKMGGAMPSVTVAPEELQTESFAPYSSNEWWTPPDEDPAWYLSTDSDPRIYWQGEGYIETVRLHAEHSYPPGGVALYYLQPGQTDYTEAQKVFARVTGEGEYTFTLGGKYVAGLRIDPDSRGGIPTRFYGVELNPASPWYLRFLPNGGQWLVLLFVPAVAAAWLALFFREE